MELSKLISYSINNREVQKELEIIIVNNYSNMLNFSIDKQSLFYLFRTHWVVNKTKKRSEILVGICMWLINNGHVLGEDYLRPIRSMVLDLIVEETEENRIECLMEELACIDKQILYKKNSSMKIPVILIPEIMINSYIHEKGI